MSYKALLVDDEELATRRLRRLLEELDDIEIIGTASNGREAVEKINQDRPDLVFLDIQMPGMNGFDVLRNVSSVPLVIFTTAFDEYALRAFEENSIDYLLKPIEKTRLVQAVEKLKRLREDPQKQETLLLELKRFAQRFRMADDKAVTQKISIKRGDATLVLDLSSVAAFVADDRLTFAWVGDKEYPVDYTLEQLEEKLAAERFFRAHRSALVSLDAIREIHTWFGGKLRLRLKGSNRELTVSRQRARALREALSL